jgi:hypothetical protein
MGTVKRQYFENSILRFIDEGATKRFPYTERQMAKSYHTSAGVFHTNGQAKFKMKFFEYSENQTLYYQTRYF